MKFPHAAKGVSKIFSAEILSLIATITLGLASLLAVITVGFENVQDEIGFGTFGILMLVCMAAGSVILVVGAILNIIGYIQTARDEDGFKRAIICFILSFVCSFVAAFFTNYTGFLGWLSTALNAVSGVLQLLTFLFAIGGLMNLSGSCHRPDMVQKGATILKVLAWTYILYLLVLILTRVFRENVFNKTLAATFSVIVILLSIVQYILYLSYLAQAKRMLREN